MKPAHALTTDPFAPLSDEELNNSSDPVGAADDFECVLPAPDNATAPSFRHGRFGVASATWAYRDSRGNLLGFACRFDHPGGGKDVLPLTWHRGPGFDGWRWRAFPSPRPLYNLNRLAEHPTRPVLVVEGEKTADAANHRFPNHVAVTWPGGAKATGKADWSPLAGRTVILWPDNDVEGRAAMARIAAALHDIGAGSVAIVAIPQSFPEKWDVADEPPAGSELDKLLRTASVEQQSAWETPDLSYIGTGRRPAPVFPIDLLGSFWGGWAESKARSASCPVDYPATSLLACTGAALGNVRWPIAGSAWAEPPILWIGLVGSPSFGKSPGLDAAKDLVRHAEDRMSVGFDDERRAYETRRQTAEAVEEKWKADVKASVKGGVAVPEKPTAADIPEPPIRARILVTDSTIEQIAVLASKLPRGLLQVRDELAGWWGSFDRYGGDGAGRTFALESYGGRSFIVDRVKYATPIRVEHLSVGVLGSVQPDRLVEMIDGRDDGFTSRFLWAWPDTLPEFRLMRTIGEDLPPKEAFNRLASLPMGSDLAGSPQPKRVRLALDAENSLEEFAREMQRRAEDAAGLLAGTIGKARGHTLRLAIILEFLWWTGSGAEREPTEISVAAVEAAAALMSEYFIPMAARVFGDAALPDADRAAMLVAKHLRRTGASRFNARTVRREIGGAVREAAAMKAACNALTEAGLVRLVQQARSGAGRDRLDYEVNPVIEGRPF